MTAVLVDWLGRGGIAQTTLAWERALRDAGHAVVVVTRRDRELTGPHVLAPPEGPHALVSHRRVARLAAATIREQRPELVVVQNYVVPPLERALDRALQAVSARRVLVLHDHRLHTAVAGTHLGLRRRVRDADVVVAHSRFVADAVGAAFGRHDVTVLPVPGTPPRPGGRSLLPPSEELTAINFGIVGRRYKGSDVVCALAASGVPGWRFAIAGTGAPVDARGATTLPGYLPGADLDATIGASTAAVLPYRTASQSGAVPLAQALGVVPIATAVGGLPEQIRSGEDGMLVASDASLADWRRALDTVADDRTRLAAGGRARVAEAALEFRERVDALV